MGGDRKGRVRWFATAMLLPGFALATGCGRKAEPVALADAKPKVVPVTVATVAQRPVERTIEVVGSLKGWDDVTIGTKRAGRVVKVLHDIGDRVEPGASLVELDAADSDLAVMQAEKQLAAELSKLGLTALPSQDFDVAKIPAVVQAHVSLERSQQNLERQRTLNQRRAGTYQDLQNAENDEQGAQAALDNATLTARATLAMARASQVALAVAKQGRTDMVIRAPVPSALPLGKTRPVVFGVSKRSVSEGQMLAVGEAVLALVVEDPLRLWTNVSERFVAEVKVDQPVRIHVLAYPGRTFQGRVARINPAVDPVSRTFQVETAVPNDEGLLRPGGFAKASILVHSEADAVIVPTESVVRFAGVTKVFVVKGDKAGSVSVETGLEGPGWVEVIGEIHAGEPVVTTGQTQLADGTAVKIREPAKDQEKGKAKDQGKAETSPVPVAQKGS